MKKNNYKYDITIIGAGLVGLVISLMLASKKIKVCIIEKNKLSNLKKNRDKRTTAISQGSKRILNEFGLWNKISKYAQGIKEIHVSEGIKNRNLKFDSKKVNNDNLGYIINNRIFKNFLLNLAINNKSIDFYDNSPVNELINLEASDKKISTQIIAGEKLFKSNLVIVADGRESNIRSLNNIKTYEYDYKQNAYVFYIEHKRNHKGIALERFFPEGPLAILPMKEKNSKMFLSSVVWTLESSLGDFSKLTKREFREEFLLKYSNFFGELGMVSKPQRYPLNLKYAYDSVVNNMVLIGDASQAIHPIAGQGFNLGIRDCFGLFNEIFAARLSGKAMDDYSFLKNFENKRILDKTVFIQTTDLLNKLFSNNNKYVAMIRSLGLEIVNEVQPLKNQLMFVAMGIRNFGLTSLFR